MNHLKTKIINKEKGSLRKQKSSGLDDLTEVKEEV
jgi:hypothetical protein